MSTIRIGSLYLDNHLFLDDANKTIGAPALSSNVIMNRRAVTSRISKEGEEVMQKVKDQLFRDFNIVVEFKWDTYCGCTSCPCSPGFKIVAKVKASLKTRVGEDYRVNVWTGKDNSIKVRRPVWTGLIETLAKYQAKESA